MAATPPAKAPSALSGTGSGSSSPINGLSASKARVAGARRTSLMNRPNSISLSQGASFKAAADAELTKLTRDQLISLLKAERTMADGAKKKSEEVKGELETVQVALAERERALAAAEGRLEERTKEVARMDEEIHRYMKQADLFASQTKEFEKARTVVRELEKKHTEQIDAFEVQRAAWLEQESSLKLRISSLSSAKASGTPRWTGTDADEETKLASSPEPVVDSHALTDEPQRQANLLGPDDADSMHSEIQFRRSPSLGGSRPHTPKALKASASSVLSPGSTLPGIPMPPEMVAELADLRSSNAALLSAQETLQHAAADLKAELGDLRRLNAQLMEENESYELLVGEKTLAGDLDLKDLLMRGAGVRSLGGSEDGGGSDGSGEGGAALGSSGSLGGRLLEGVAEDDEEDLAGEEEDVEAMILETQGSGSRTTGAVEAQTTKKKVRNIKPGGGGLGLDLAAELAQAEEEEQAMKEAEEKKRLRRQQMRQASSMSIGGDVGALQKEVKALKDANKALSLYISKIIDRIVALDGFEKVLSQDYAKSAAPSHQSPFTLAKAGDRASLRPVTSSLASPNPASPTPSPTVSASSTPKPVEKPPGKRMSIDWKGLFGGGGSKPPPANAPPPGMKPLRLGTKDAEDDEEDQRERERLRAEMRLHGIEKSGSPQFAAARGEGTVPGIEQALGSSAVGGDPSGAVLSRASSVRISRRLSDRRGGAADPAPAAPPSPLPPVTGASILRRSEEREADLKANLEKGTAGGFTEIRGHRRRPSTTTTAAATRSGASTPGQPASRSPGPDGPGRRSVSPAVPPVNTDVPPPPGHEGVASPSSESMLSRAAKRLSHGWSSSPAGTS